MRIELENIGVSGRSFAHTYQDGELEFTDERVRLLEGPEVSGVILTKGNEVTATGRVTARTEVDCDRCLKSFEIPVRADFSLKYVTPGEYERIHAAELEETDLALSVFDGEAIDVDEIVREQVLLAVPTRSLCREDCKGFCPTCGGDRNLKECDCQTEDIDPRWAGLKDLTDRKS
ncbi:MAG TPA: DUF177 domain-containing protein [Pyrinomonadaceae bacterium]|nr:DUF177 domain-containing protein [Pyrinomonadaceae bacterium]